MSVDSEAVLSRRLGELGRDVEFTALWPTLPRHVSFPLYGMGHTPEWDTTRNSRTSILLVHPVGRRIRHRRCSTSRGYTMLPSTNITTWDPAQEEDLDLVQQYALHGCNCRPGSHVHCVIMGSEDGYQLSTWSESYPLALCHALLNACCNNS